MSYEFVRPITEENLTREYYEGLFEECANSLQGFYGRWYYENYLYASEEDKDMFCSVLKEAGVVDMMDFIIFMEA